MGNPKPTEPAATPSSAAPVESPRTPQPPWQPVAAGFARDFTRLGTGQADWHTRVSRWTSPYLTQQYEKTDPHRIPAASLTRLTTVAVGRTTVDFRASYDTGLTLACRVELGPTGWKLTRVLPTQE